VLDTRFGADRHHPLFIAQLLCSRYEMGIYIPGLNISDEDAAARLREFDLVLHDDDQDMTVVRRQDVP